MRITKKSKPAYRLVLLGGGRVGRTLGYLLKQRGHSVAMVIARTPSHARQAARFIGQGRATTDPRRLDSVDWDVLLMATPDQVLAPMARSLAHYPLAWRTKTILHCSGSLNSTVLRPLADQGAAVGSLHPLQTFARPSEAIHAVRGSYFAVEGDRRGLRIIRSLVADLEGQAIKIPTAGKTLYHCAAFLACGHMSTLISISISLLERMGISSSQARALLHPLITRTVENLMRMPAAQAITGPISRGDIETVRAHLRSLEETDPLALALYKQLGDKMVDLVKGHPLPAREARLLKRLFQGSGL